ncbi:polysaccharide biosynthesis C-terminal domain-containing protein [Candidatus Kapaibacterium sp.]
MREKLKQLANDSIIYGISSVVTRFLSFILTPLYSNFLSTSQFDYLIYIFSFTTLLSVVYSLGMETTYLRYYEKNNLETSKKAFTYAYASINVFSLLITILIIVFSEQIIQITPYYSQIGAKDILILAAFIPFIDVLTYIPFNYLRIANKALMLSIIRLVSSIASLGLHYYLIVNLSYQAEGAIWSQIGANSISFLILIPLIINNLTGIFDKDLFKSMLRYAVGLLPGLISLALLQVIDKPLIKYITNNELSITNYQVNLRLAVPMLIFVSIFDFAYQPFFIKHSSESDSKSMFGRVLTYYILASSFLFLIISFFMRYFAIMPVFDGNIINSKYWDGLSMIPIILLAYFFYGLYVNFSIGSIVEKKTLYNSIVLISGVITNFAANLILVPLFDFYGAAYSLLISYIVVSCLMYILNRKIFPIEFEFRNIIKIVLITLFAYSVPFVFDIFVDSMILSIFVKVFSISLMVFFYVYFDVVKSGELKSLSKILFFKK